MNKEEMKQLLIDEKDEVQDCLERIQSSHIILQDHGFDVYRSPEEEVTFAKEQIRDELSAHFPNEWFDYVVENLAIWVGYSSDTNEYEDKYGEQYQSLLYFDHNDENLAKTKKLLEIQKVMSELITEYNNDPHEVEPAYADDESYLVSRSNEIIPFGLTGKKYCCFTHEFEDVMAWFDEE